MNKRREDGPSAQRRNFTHMNRAASLALSLLSLTVLPLLAFTNVPSPVPEPSTIALVGGGLAAAILYSRRRRGQK